MTDAHAGNQAYYGGCMSIKIVYLVENSDLRRDKKSDAESLVQTRQEI